MQGVSHWTDRRCGIGAREAIIIIWLATDTTGIRPRLIRPCMSPRLARLFISATAHRAPVPRTSSLLRRAMSTPSRAVLASRAVLSTIDLSQYDAEQSRLMDERCILIDEDDTALGAADKKTCTSSPCPSPSRRRFMSLAQAISWRT